MNDFSSGAIFPLGEENDAYARYFTGKSYLRMLSTCLLYTSPVDPVEQRVPVPGKHLELVLPAAFPQAVQKPCDQVRAAAGVHEVPDLSLIHIYEIKSAVRIREDDEQRRFAVAQGVQLQLVLRHEVPQFLEDVYKRQVHRCLQPTFVSAGLSM